MPAPAAESDAYVSPKRARSQSEAPMRTPETAAPSVTRASGPIQPRSTASTKKKTIPRRVTAPPVHASARAPRRTERSIGSRCFRCFSGVGGGHIGAAATGSGSRSGSNATRGSGPAWIACCCSCRARRRSDWSSSSILRRRPSKVSRRSVSSVMNGGFPAPRASVLEPGVHGYAPIRGLARTKEAIAARYRDVYGVDLDPQTEVALIPGTKTGIVELAQSLCDEGDTLLLPDPYYPDYPSGPALAGARLQTVPLVPELGWAPELGGAPDAAAIYLNYPS